MTLGNVIYEIAKDKFIKVHQRAEPVSDLSLAEVSTPGEGSAHPLPGGSRLSKEVSVHLSQILCCGGGCLTWIRK